MSATKIALRNGSIPSVLGYEAEEGGSADALRLAAALPADPMLANQTYLAGGPGGINAVDAWARATGKGVVIGIVDAGFDRLHGDLVANYDTSLDWDFIANDDDAMVDRARMTSHGTAVASLAIADDNGWGMVGVAHDSSMAGFRLLFNAEAPLTSAMAVSDVVNNSWIGGRFGSMTSGQPKNYVPAIITGAVEGRDGLGTVWVFAAGNDRAAGGNANYHTYQSSIYSMTVAATDADGVVAPFSSPGASVHVSAPGVNLPFATLSMASFGTASDFGVGSGTSFAAPLVSGVAALMLEVNPGLGWRDVQEIIGSTARMTDADNDSWLINGADKWNGGGMHHSVDYGFGMVDAAAAVRLAETWQPTGTSASMLSGSASKQVRGNLADNGAPLVSSVSMTRNVEIDKVEVTVDLKHSRIGDLEITLVSPEGTESVLMDNPGVTATSAGMTLPSQLTWTFSSSQFWGESSKGTWTLRVQDNQAGEVGSLASWKLAVHGDRDVSADVYVFTDAYAVLGADPERQVIGDAAGIDTLNFSAMTQSVSIDLVKGGVAAGQQVIVAAGTVLERLYGGAGDDSLRGNAKVNIIRGGEGDDTLAGAYGNDYFVASRDGGDDVMADFQLGDQVWLTQGVAVAELQGSLALLSDGGSLWAQNGYQWSMADFVARPDWLLA